MKHFFLILCVDVLLNIISAWMMITVMNEATFLCVSAVGGRRSGWMGGYKMQDSDSRDPGSHPESCVCSGLVQVSERCCCGLNVH